MAGTMKIRTLGIVENYSFLRCPDCGKEIPVFGKSNIDEVADEIGLKVLGKLPIDPAFAQMADEGRFDEIDMTELAPAVEKLATLRAKASSAK